MRHRRPWLWILVTPALLCPAAAPADAASSEVVTYTIAEGETHKGDLYLGSTRIHIEGTLDGDLYAFTQMLSVTGVVTGDINAWAQTIGLDGDMRDSVRVCGQTITVTGTIDGDLLAFGQIITVEKGAHITGDVRAGGAQIQIDGLVDGDLDATGGAINLGGTVGQDASLEADVINIAPETRIGHDLDYTSRNRLDLEDKDIVAGSIDYTPGKKKPPVSSRGAGYWFAKMLTGLLAGLAALALFRRRAPEIVATVGTDGLRSAGVGFLAAIVVPVALCIACILIVTIPIVIIAFLLFALVIYLAKIPVAVWLGSAVLKGLGRADDSPYLALVIGTPVLYLVFAIPFLGKITWFAALFVGLGAIVLTLWSARQARLAAGSPPPPGAPPAPASVSPA